jgi:hypothetical protein
VAGLTKIQTAELQAHGITTVAQLAAMPKPMPWKPQRGSRQSYEKARDQARLQVETRDTGELRYELLPVDLTPPLTGLCLLPAPSDGDIFFDIEGDPFVGEHGLEYLFGYGYRDAGGNWVYEGDWALGRAEERAAFEAFVDFVMARREVYPDLHVYHYAPYEPGALKRLMGRFATREDEIDDLLRGKVLVDLYSVVRNALRAGVESYSIKRLEPLYGFSRSTDLHAANIALTAVQAGLELADTPSITDDDRRTVAAYNQDDCVSAAALRDWLEERRAEVIARGEEVARPTPGEEGPGEELGARQERIEELIVHLTDGISDDPAARTPQQQAHWVLANLLNGHRREYKATWWEYFRLAALTAEELIDERPTLARLIFVADVTPPRARTRVHRYSFPQQDTDLREGDSLRIAGGEPIGRVAAISPADRTVDINCGNPAGRRIPPRDIR